MCNRWRQWPGECANRMRAFWPLFDYKVELTAGHELLIVPLMHGLHNNAANFTIAGLNIR